MTDSQKSTISKGAAARGYVSFEKSFKENLTKYDNYSRGYAESLAIMDSIPDMLEATILAVLEEIDS